MGSVLQESERMKSFIALLCVFVSSVSGHTKGTDAYAYLDLELPVGTYCAPRRPITDWSVNIDRWVSAAGVNTNNAQYSGGYSPLRWRGSTTAACPSGEGRGATMTGLFSEMETDGMQQLELEPQE